MAQRFPAKLGACIDLAYTARQERLEMEREFEEKVAVLKEREQAIKDHIINTFKKAEIEGAKGSVASAGIITADKYRPKDWLAVWGWAVKNDAADLFEKRLTQTAVRDRYEAGTLIPGVEVFTKIDLSLTKINKK